ncbi:unnamed protein product, partial [Porites lobata]
MLDIDENVVRRDSLIRVQCFAVLGTAVHMHGAHLVRMYVLPHGGYDMKSLTAEPNKHYKAAAGEQLAFGPGEIYKEVKIGIINTDNSFEGNKTFQVIFSSSQRSVTMKGPQQVNVTIMYTKASPIAKPFPQFT